MAKKPNDIVPASNILDDVQVSFTRSSLSHTSKTKQSFDYVDHVIQNKITEKQIKDIENRLQLGIVNVTKRLFKTPKEISDQLNRYFVWCAVKERIPIDAECAIALDLSRDEFREMRNDKGQIGEIIKKAITICEASAIRLLFKGGGVPTGAIFLLKQMGYSDQIIDKYEDNRKVTSITIVNNNSESAKKLVLNLDEISDAEIEQGDNDKSD